MFLCYLTSVPFLFVVFLVFLNHNSNNRWLSNNDLTGSIPSELGMLSRSTVLYVSLFPHICSLSFVVLFFVFLNHNPNNRALDDNLLTGSIPSELGNLSSLAVLYVFLFPHICSLAFVVLFLVFLNHNSNNRWLSTNDLTGSIPSELGMLSALVDLYVSLLPHICFLSFVVLFLVFLNHNFNNRWLSTNDLTGSIPSELGNLSNLTYLYVSLLPHICSLSFVVLFLVFLNHNFNNRQLSTNDLTGSIPSELGMLSNLANLYVSLLPHICSFSFVVLLLVFLFFSSRNADTNDFSGILPTSICNGFFVTFYFYFFLYFFLFVCLSCFFFVVLVVCLFNLFVYIYEGVLMRNQPNLIVLHPLS